jgi:thiol-disulfide isomerase/thioredoxin
MKKSLILVSALLIGIFLVLVQRARQSNISYPGETEEIGRPAPSFQLKDLEGNMISLEDFKGKVVMLDFWATWCAPCRATMPELERLQQEHPDDFVLLAVNLGEDEDLVAPYVQSRQIQTRVLLDTDRSVGTAYGTTSIPIQFIIDKEGILRHTQVGAYQGWKEDLWAQIEKLK